MRSLRGAVLALTLFPALCLAGEPKATLKGPTNAAVDAEFWLKFSGSVSEKPLVLELAQGPEPVSPAVLYNQAGQPIYAVTSVGKPGTYIFALIAEGTDAGNNPKRAYSFWTVAVNGAAPVPDPGPPNPPPTPPVPPVPPPTPPPVPPPVPPTPPAPTPVPQATKLYAIGVYSGDTRSADELAFSLLRNDPSLVPALAALNVEWRAMDRNSSAGLAAIDQWRIRPWIGDPAFGPSVTVFDDAGNVYGLDGARIDRANPRPTHAPKLTSDIVNAFKKIRGVN